MTLPIWDQNQAGIAKARFAVVQRQKDLEDLHDEIAQAVAKSLSRTRTLSAVAVLYDAQVQPNDAANIEGARALYETGQQNILVLLDAQEALIAHQRRHVETLRDYAVALVDLELALGGPLSDFNQANANGDLNEDTP
jgi:cobalt-zinc-cadmium efflux system outer membrane protein